MSERRIGLPRDPLIWLFVVTICLSIIGTYDLAREIGTPFPGYLSYRRSTSPTGEIDANTPVWWSGLIGNRLAKGDTLVAAAGDDWRSGSTKAVSRLKARADMGNTSAAVPTTAWAPAASSSARG